MNQVFKRRDVWIVFYNGAIMAVSYATEADALDALEFLEGGK